MAPRSRSRSTHATSRVLRRFRGGLLAIAAVRIAAGVVALALAAILYRDHYLWLALLRPTKEVLLVGGLFARRGDVNVLHLVAAAIPLAVVGVWLFYALGLAYAREIGSGKLPFGVARILPPDKIKKMEKVLHKKGMKIVFFGRLAIFPSAVIAAAAGACHMDVRRFLLADGAGAMLSLVEVIGAGFLFGEAYERAGPWVTGLGIAALLGVLFVLGRALMRD